MNITRLLPGNFSINYIFPEIRIWICICELPGILKHTAIYGGGKFVSLFSYLLRQIKNVFGPRNTRIEQDSDTNEDLSSSRMIRDQMLRLKTMIKDEGCGITGEFRNSLLLFCRIVDRLDDTLYKTFSSMEQMDNITDQTASEMLPIYSSILNMYTAVIQKHKEVLEMCQSIVDLNESLWEVIIQITVLRSRHMSYVSGITIRSVSRLKIKVLRVINKIS